MNHYSYQKMLMQASKGMVHVRDMHKLSKLIVYIVKKYIGLHSASIFLYDESVGSFVLKCRRGENKEIDGVVIEDRHPVPVYLKDKKNAVVQKDAKVSRGMKKELDKLHCSVCIPSFWNERLLGFLILGDKRSGEVFTEEEVDLLSTLSNSVAIAIENAKNHHKLKSIMESERKNYFQTIFALARTVDEKDAYTRGHLDEVAKYGMEVAKELSKSARLKIDIEDLKTALLLHDIGKIGVPDALLNKPGKLTPDEWSVMKQHPEIGARIIEPISKLKRVGNIVRHHQEKYDGSGYPDGLKSQEIPFESRIIAVVDAFHAMTSNRPYRNALSEKVALKELEIYRGKQFDPVVVDAFMRAWKKGKIKR